MAIGCPDCARKDAAIAELVRQLSERPTVIQVPIPPDPAPPWPTAVPRWPGGTITVKTPETGTLVMINSSGPAQPDVYETAIRRIRQGNGPSVPARDVLDIRT